MSLNEDKIEKRILDLSMYDKMDDIGSKKITGYLDAWHITLFSNNKDKIDAWMSCYPFKKPIEIKLPFMRTYIRGDNKYNIHYLKIINEVFGHNTVLLYPCEKLGLLVIKYKDWFFFMTPRIPVKYKTLFKTIEGFKDLTGCKCPAIYKKKEVDSS